MADNMKVDLVERTLTKAFHRWPLLAGCIHHSDRGSQFTAESVAKLLQKHGIQQSFSRVGKPGDNPWSESFFANLKKEAVHWRTSRLEQKPGKRYLRTSRVFTTLAASKNA